MKCSHCGAKLHKSDIFCIKCETPVLTEDDITLMPNAETTKFINEAQYTEIPLKDDSPGLVGTPGGGDTLSAGDTLNVGDTLNAGDTLNVGDAPGVGDTLSADISPGIDAALNSDAIMHSGGGNQADGDLTAKSSNTSSVDEATKVMEPEQALDELTPGKLSKINNNRKAIIVTAIIVCAVIVGLGLFLLLRSPRAQQDDARLQAAGDLSADGADQSADADTPAVIQPLEVSSIILLNDGREQNEFHTRVNESITLRVRLLPDGVFQHCL